jgi:hypothetical protein
VGDSSSRVRQRGNKRGFYTGHKRLLYLPSKKQFYKTELFFFAFWDLLVDFCVRNCLFLFFHVPVNTRTFDDFAQVEKSETVLGCFLILH